MIYTIYPKGVLCKVFLFIALFATLSSANTLVVNNPSQNFRHFTMQMLEDPSKKLEIEDIRRSNSFHPVANAFSLGYSQSNFWFKIELFNQTQNRQHYILESTELSAHFVDFYLLHDKQIEKHYATGVGRLNSAGVVENKNPTFTLTLEPLERKSIYIKSFSLFPTYTSFQLLTPFSYYASNLLHAKMLYLYFGIALALIVYNLFLFLYSRERSYLLYVVYASFFTLWQISLYGYPPFDTNSSVQSYYMTGAIIPIWVGFLVLFTREILNLKRHFPKVNALLFGVGMLYMGLALFSWIELTLAFSIINTLSTIILPLLLFMGFMSYMAGNRVALFYLTAQLPFLFTSTLYSLMSDGFLEYNLVTRFGIVVGSTFELFVFSLALGYKLKQLEMEKIEAIQELNRALERKVSERTKELEDANKALHKLSITDKLTKLLNRTGIDRHLFDALNRYKENNESFGIILLDIDLFKRINDRYGHDVGDRVLAGIAHVLKEQTRPDDVVGRWGGEEFLIICSQTQMPALLSLAHRLRQRIASYEMKNIQSVTASFGLAVIEPNESTTELLKRADKNLYKAKEQGRDSVVS